MEWYKIRFDFWKQLRKRGGIFRQREKRTSLTRTLSEYRLKYAGVWLRNADVEVEGSTPRPYMLHKGCPSPHAGSRSGALTILLLAGCIGNLSVFPAGSLPVISRPPL